LRARIGKLGVLAIVGVLGAGCGDSSTEPKTPPVITSVDPTTVNISRPFQLTVIGTGFRSNSVVKAGTAQLPTQFVSETELRATVTATQFTTATTTTITVDNGNSGGPSNAVTLDVVANICAIATTIAIGQTLAGSLSTADCRLDDNSFADPFRLRITAQTTVQIDLQSTTFDAYLVLTDSAGTTLVENDNGPTGNNSRIVRQLAPGVYFIYANSFNANTTGAYTLAVTTAATADPCLISSAVPIALGQTLNGTLTTTDCRLPEDGSYADLYRLVLSGTTTVTIDMAASFDTYLFVFNTANQVVAEDDDSGDGTNARIVATLTAGTYYIGANTALSSVFGNYTISVR